MPDKEVNAAHDSKTHGRKWGKEIKFGEEVN